MNVDDCATPRIALRRSIMESTEDAPEMCIANIGPGERRKRMRGGYVAAGLTLVVAVALLATGVDRAWRLFVFLPAAMSAIGFFQAREQT